MRGVLVACLAVLGLAAQELDVQKLVEELYPQNDRMKEMRVGEMVRELGIHSGSKVADVGCGTGEFSVVLAKVVGATGQVTCVDVDELKQARRNFKKYGVRVATVKGSDDDPKLAMASFDAVLIVNAYHEMENWQAMLRHIREALRPQGRLVICDNTPHRTAARPRQSQANNHVIAEALVAADLETSGFKILRRDSEFASDPDSESQHWLIVASAPR